MLLRRCAVAVVGLIALAPALTACGSDGGEITTGDVVQAREDDQFVGKGQESLVALPIGRLEITLGERTSSVSAKDNRQLEALEAPEGDTFVPISWQYDAATFGDYAEFIDAQTSPVINVVTGGASYRIPAPDETGEGSESFYVLVNGSAKDVSMKVDFDGVSQTVDLGTGERDEGRAAPLYDLKPPRTKSRSCDANSVFDVEAGREAATFRCRITSSMRLPYAGGAWAAEGQTWLVLSLRTTLVNYVVVADDYKSGAVYAGSGITSTFRLGKVKAAKVLDDESVLCPDVTTGTCTGLYHLVFAAKPKATGQLVVGQTYALALASGVGNEGAETPTLKGRLRIPVR